MREGLNVDAVIKKELEFGTVDFFAIWCDHLDALGVQSVQRFRHRCAGHNPGYPGRSLDPLADLPIPAVATVETCARAGENDGFRIDLHERLDRWLNLADEYVQRRYATRRGIAMVKARSMEGDVARKQILEIHLSHAV